MSDAPLLNKMDALLKKHRGPGETNSNAPADPGLPAEPSPPPNAWLPVLTQVIERGTPPAAAAPATATSVPAAAPVEQAPPAADTSASLVNEALAEQLLGELTPRLSEVMEKQLAAQLRKNLDQTVATLLSQLDVNVREIVRDAVAEKLKQPRDPSA